MIALMMFVIFIFSFFVISLAGIRIAGVLIIMRAAYGMLNPESAGKKLSDEDQAAALQKEDVSFSPLALPLLSGPGSIAVVIGFSTQAVGVMDYLIYGISFVSVVAVIYGLFQLRTV